MWELVAWNCPKISLSMVINEGRLRDHYDSKRGNTLCQCRRTDRAVFDTMPVVNPWAPLQSMLYCGTRSLHGSLFDGVKYSLKPGLMDTRNHLIKLELTWNQLPRGLMDNNLDPSQTNLISLSVGLLSQFSVFVKVWEPQDHTYAGTEKPALFPVA
jgi:hypothetical protein